MKNIIGTRFRKTLYYLDYTSRVELTCHRLSQKFSDRVHKVIIISFLCAVTTDNLIAFKDRRWLVTLTRFRSHRNYCCCNSGPSISCAVFHCAHRKIVGFKRHNVFWRLQNLRQQLFYSKFDTKIIYIQYGKRKEDTFRLQTLILKSFDFKFQFGEKEEGIFFCVIKSVTLYYENVLLFLYRKNRFVVLTSFFITGR